MQNMTFGISKKALIQKLINITKIENGQIIIKVQNGRFVYLSVSSGYKVEELDNTEIENNEKNKEIT